MVGGDDDGDRLGVDRQEHLCRQLHADRDLGGVIVDAYVDNSISAFRRKRRPQFDRLIDDIKNGVVDALVVYNPIA